MTDSRARVEQERSAALALAAAKAREAEDAQQERLIVAMERQADALENLGTYARQAVYALQDALKRGGALNR